MYDTACICCRRINCKQSRIYWIPCHCERRCWWGYSIQAESGTPSDTSVSHLQPHAIGLVARASICEGAGAQTVMASVVMYTAPVVCSVSFLAKYRQHSTALRHSAVPAAHARTPLKSQEARSARTSRTGRSVLPSAHASASGGASQGEPVFSLGSMRRGCRTGERRYCGAHGEVANVEGKQRS